MPRCFSCQREIRTVERVGRTESCECGADLHCCRNCRFYDPSAYNECRETQAERVLDKERANFCDYFELGGLPAVGPKNDAAQARRRLEALFRKKS